MTLSLLFTLFSLLFLPPAFSQELVVTPVQFEKSLALIREIYAKPVSRKILNQAFKGLLIDGQKELTETQLIYFLSENDEVVAGIRNYLTEVTKVEEAQTGLLKTLVKKYEKKLGVKIDKINLNRLIVRELRGKTPVAAISKFLKEMKVSDQDIEAMVKELKDLEIILDDQLKPISQKYTAMFKEYLKDELVLDRFRKYADPNTRLVIKTGEGHVDYEVKETYVNHPTQDLKGKWLPADDIENQAYIHAIRDIAKYNYASNIFQIDLPSYANELAGRTDLLERKQGIDKSNVDAFENDRKVYETLVKGGVKTTLVITSNLNHPKMAAINYGYPGFGYVLALTANATQSCSGKEGDLLNLDPPVPESIPNSNMGALIKSDILASIFNHEISKSVDLLFKGTDFPVGGIISVKGEGTLSVAFTPNGANNSMLDNFYAAAIDASNNPHLGGVFFVESGGKMASAIIRWGLRLYEQGIEPQPDFIYHKMFAMQGWSDPQLLVGLKLVGSKEEGNLQYIDDPESELVKKLTPEQLARWREGFKVASRRFQDGFVERDGVKYEYSVKIHNKLLAIGDLDDPKKLVVNMSSFNPSQNAESNQEYALQAEGDSKFSDMARRVIRYHSSIAQHSVYKEAMLRNQKVLKFDDPIDPEVDRAKNRSASKRAAPQGKQAAAYDLSTKSKAKKSLESTETCNANLSVQGTADAPQLPKNN